MTTGKRGGKREGAGGRPKPVVAGEFTAETFLQAVVRGEIPCEPGQRIGAARSLLRYESPIARLPLPAKTPKEMERLGLMSADKRRLEEFERKAAAIRAKYAAKGNGGA